MPLEKQQFRPGLTSADDGSECADYEGQQRCLAGGLDYGQVKKLRAIIRSRDLFQQGEAVYRMESPFKSIFSIQSGSIKTETCSHDGAKIITGFYFTGDLFGLDAVGDKTYSHDAIALEPTRVCELPFEQLQSACTDLPKLQCKLFQLLGKRVRVVNEKLECGHTMVAEGRVLKFLQYLAQNRELGRDGIIKLPMTKEDIASYLNMRPESLSRALAKLKQKGIICKHKNLIELAEKGE